MTAALAVDATLWAVIKQRSVRQKEPRMSVVTVPPDNSFSPSLSRWRLGPARLLASFLVAMLMAGLSVVGVQMQAQAASNDPPIYGHGANRFFAYLQPGEFLVADGNISAVTAPDGTLVGNGGRSEEHTSELQSRGHLVCRLLLEKKKKKSYI